MKLNSALLIIFSLLFLLATTKSQDFPAGSCGDQAGGALCAEGFCCSKWGWCGNTPAYCDAENCDSQCPPPPSPSPPPPSLPPPPPPSSPPPPPGVIYCGINFGGATCPPTMCCTIMGACFPLTSSVCINELCQSQCGAAPTCGVDAGGALCGHDECCTIAGLCARKPSFHICDTQFCQSQCNWGKSEPASISLFKAIA